jgi:hypothetical protein
MGHNHRPVRYCRNILGDHTAVIKGLDTFETVALLTAIVGVIGGGVALFILGTHV